jgi:hypothetical protein
MTLLPSKIAFNCNYKGSFSWATQISYYILIENLPLKWCCLTLTVQLLGVVLPDNNALFLCKFIWFWIKLHSPADYRIFQIFFFKVYVDVGGSTTDSATLAFTFGTPLIPIPTSLRKWNIKVTQIPCSSPVK